MDEGLLNDLLECSVCLERLDTSSRVLPCQHTFCIKCLKEIVQSHKELRCPECRVLVDTRVEDLPPNVLLMRILEGMKGKSGGINTTPNKPSTNIQQSQFLSDSFNAPHHLQHKTGMVYNYSKVGREKDGNVYMQNQDPNTFGGHIDAASSQLVRLHDPARQHGEFGVTNVAPHARALYDYLSKDAGNLSFKKGDIIFLRKRIDTHWCYGEVGGNQGAFPINYTQVIVPLPASTVPQCKALYDFRMAAPDEDGCLAFDKGAIITVIRRVDENWAEGRLNDRIGIFPIAFVEMNAPARSLMKISANFVNRSIPAASHNESTTGAPNSQPRVDQQVLNNYRQQSMSLSTPIPSSGVAVPGSNPMSQSQPVSSHPTQHTSTVVTQISSIVQEPDPRSEPDIIQLVYGSHANAAQLLVQSLQAANSKLNNPETANSQANLAGQEAYQKARANIKQFQNLSSSYHATNNLASDSSSSTTTPSFGGSSATTTPNISSSNTSSSESNTPSSPASPATNVQSRNNIDKNITQQQSQIMSKHNYQNVIPPMSNQANKQANSGLNTSSSEDPNTSNRSQEISLESGENNTTLNTSGTNTTLSAEMGRITISNNSSIQNVSMESPPRSNMSSPQTFNSSNNVTHSTPSPMIIHSHPDMKCAQQQSANIHPSSTNNSNRDISQYANSGLYTNAQTVIVSNPFMINPSGEATTQSENYSNIVSPRHGRDGQMLTPSRSGYPPHHREKRHSLTPGGVALPKQSSSTPNRRSMEYMTLGNGIGSAPPRSGHPLVAETQTSQSVDNSRKQDSKRERERDVKLPAPYVALYPYKPQKGDELELKKGVLYTVVERCYDGWYKGYLNSNAQKCGVFPGNYVAPVHSKSKHRSSKSGNGGDGKNASKSGSCSLTNGVGSNKKSDTDCTSSATQSSSSSIAAAKTNQPPDLPPRACSPNNFSISFSSTHKPSSSSKSSEKSKEKSRGEKTPTSMSFMKRLAAMKKSKSPPPQQQSNCSQNPGFSMDNPVFEDCSVPQAQQSVHVRSGSCPSQLLQPENIVEPIPGGPHATVGPTGAARIINSSRIAQTLGPAHAAGPRIRTRPSLVNATLTAPPQQPAQSGDGPWHPISSTNRPQHQHRKSHSLDAGQQLRTRDSVPTKERFRCIVPYPPNSEYELELQVDDVVVVHRKWGDGWYKGTHERTGKTGLFPASFVETC